MTSAALETTYARELSGTESFMAGISSTVSVVLHGRGRLDERLVREAVELLLAANPVLGGRAVRNSDSAGHALRLERRSAAVLAFVEGDPDLPLLDRECLLTDGEVFSLHVTTRGERFRLAFSYQHALADGQAILAYTYEMLTLYKDLATNGSAAPKPVRPVPLSPEEALSERGITKLDFEEFLRQSYGEEAAAFFALTASSTQMCSSAAEPVAQEVAAEQFSVARGRLRLTREQTAALVALGRRSGVSVHGLVFAAATLAELFLADAPDALTLLLRSAVDVRSRIDPPIAVPTTVTNLTGNSTALLLAQRGDDPIAWAKQVCDQLAADVERGIVPQSLLQMSSVTDIMRGLGDTGLIPDMVFVTNMGVVPTLPAPAEVVLDDMSYNILANPGADQLAAKARQSLGASRNRFYCVSTFDGRLNLDLSLYGGSETVVASLVEALSKAFDSLLAG